MYLKNTIKASVNIVLGYPRKNPNRGAEDMELPGVLKKKYADIPQVN